MIKAHAEHFYKELLAAVGATLTAKTEIGAVFSLRKIQDGFQSYTVYCGNHGLAMEELELVMRDKEVARVLEGCRLLVEKSRSALETLLSDQKKSRVQNLSIPVRNFRVLNDRHMCGFSRSELCRLQF